MLRKILVIITLFFTCSTSAQQARVQKFTTPLAGTVVLKDVEDKYNAHVDNLEAPAPDASFEKMQLRKIKEQVAKQYPHKRSTAQNKTTAALPPIVEKGFVADSLSGIPPDNDMAISKANKAVSVMNSSIAILDANTGLITSRKSLKLYSLPVGLNNLIKDTRYDPKVIYDAAADRFISIMLNSTDADNYIVIGFSLSNDPQGSWSFYKFYGDYGSDTTWFDYPSIAITKDEFFFTGNKIKFNTSWQAGFTQTLIYQVKKQDGYDSAATLNYQIWDSIGYGGKSIRNLYPVKAGFNQLLGPEQYFLSNRNFDVQNDTVFLIKVPDVISSGNTNLQITPLILPIKYGTPPNGRQPDTSVVLATNDGRILGAYAMDDEIQFVSTTVNTPNGASGIYHGKISNYKTSPAISHAQIFSVDTLDFGYPNVAFSGNPWGLNQSIISFNYTGPNTYPGVAAITFNGIEYSELVKIKQGDSSIKILPGKEQRWGDYMGAQPDYSQYGSVWVLGIYGRSDNRYGNWMAKLNSPLLSIKDKKTDNGNAILYPNPSFQYIRIEFELQNEGTTNFVIYNTQGQKVDQLLQQKCKKGKNVISFNVAPLSTGNYYLRLVSQDGELLSTHSFTKQ
jgi:hypothetical protein